MTPILSLGPDDARYPRGLTEVGYVRPLRVWGALPEGPSVAVVGTRKPSPEAVTFTERLAKDLSTAGYAVWSGGAIGIDAAAHRGALEGSGRTVAVLGSGLGALYPPEHAELFAAIVAAGGAVVSPFDDEVTPLTWRFFDRNRLMTAATCATVVTECGLKSGARNSTHHARRFGRPIYCVPHPPWSEGRGTLVEIQLGASVFAGSRDLLRQLHEDPPRVARASSQTVFDWGTGPDTHAEGARRAEPRSRSKEGPARRAEVRVSDPEDPILLAVSKGALDVEEVSRMCGLALPLVLQEVSRLMLTGELEETVRGLVLAAPGKGRQ